MSADVVSDLLHHESSLLGVSGPSDDMHTLLSIEYSHFQQSTPIKFSRRAERHYFLYDNKIAFWRDVVCQPQYGGGGEGRSIVERVLAQLD